MAISEKVNTVTEVAGIINQINLRSSTLFIQLNHTLGGAPPAEGMLTVKAGCFSKIRP